MGEVYQHSSPGAPDSGGPFPKFAGDELKDFLFAKAIECFSHGWGRSEVHCRVEDWHILKAAIGSVLSDEEVEGIVVRAERISPTISISEADNAVALDPRHRDWRGDRRPPRTNIRKVVIRRG